MNKEVAKQILKDYPNLKDNEIVNIVSTSNVWTGFLISDISPCTFKSYTAKEIKQIANG